MAVPNINRPPIQFDPNNPSNNLLVQAFAGNEPIDVIIKGTTTDATAGVELFVDGVANYRLKVPESGILYGFYIGASFCTNDDAQAQSGAWGFFMAQNRGGTVSMLTNSPSQTTFPTASPAVAVAVTADNTNKSVKFAVTGVAAKTFNHEFKVFFGAISPTGM